MPFTPEELEEMEKADQEIEESFVLTIQLVFGYGCEYSFQARVLW